MKLTHAIAAICITTVLLATACHTPPAAHNGSIGSNPSVNAPSPTVIEKSGFGGSGDYLWVTSIVRNVPVGQFATVSFNLYGADGALLATESQTEQSINHGARIVVGTQVTAPKGQPVTRIEPTFKVSDHSPVGPVKFSNVVLQVGAVTMGQDTFGGATAEAALTNPSDEQIPGARVGVVCFDQQGAITGGGSAFPNLVPAKGQVKVSARLVVSGPPDHCEMAAQPSGF
jgi:hypothetical protein